MEKILLVKRQKTVRWWTADELVSNRYRTVKCVEMKILIFCFPRRRIVDVESMVDIVGISSFFFSTENFWLCAFTFLPISKWKYQNIGEHLLMNEQFTEESPPPSHILNYYDPLSSHIVLRTNLIDRHKWSDGIIFFRFDHFSSAGQSNNFCFWWNFIAANSNTSTKKMGFRKIKVYDDAHRAFASSIHSLTQGFFVFFFFSFYRLWIIFVSTEFVFCFLSFVVPSAWNGMKSMNETHAFTRFSFSFTKCEWKNQIQINCVEMQFITFACAVRVWTSSRARLVLRDQWMFQVIQWMEWCKARNK